MGFNPFVMVYQMHIGFSDMAEFCNIVINT